MRLSRDWGLRGRCGPGERAPGPGPQFPSVKRGDAGLRQRRQVWSSSTAQPSTHPGMTRAGSLGLPAPQPNLGAHLHPSCPCFPVLGSWPWGQATWSDWVFRAPVSVLTPESPVPPGGLEEGAACSHNRLWRPQQEDVYQPIKAPAWLPKN